MLQRIKVLDLFTCKLTCLINDSLPHKSNVSELISSTCSARGNELEKSSSPNCIVYSSEVCMNWICWGNYSILKMRTKFQKIVLFLTSINEIKQINWGKVTISWIISNHCLRTFQMFAIVSIDFSLCTKY